jgi:hypothetical protein
LHPDIQQPGGGAIGFSNDAFIIGDEIAQGGGLKEVVIVVSLFFKLEARLLKLFVLLLDFLVRDPQFLQRNQRFFRQRGNDFLNLV